MKIVVIVAGCRQPVDKEARVTVRSPSARGEAERVSDAAVVDPLLSDLDAGGRVTFATIVIARKSTEDTISRANHVSDPRRSRRAIRPLPPNHRREGRWVMARETAREAPAARGRSVAWVRHGAVVVRTAVRLGWSPYAEWYSVGCSTIHRSQPLNSADANFGRFLPRSGTSRTPPGERCCPGRAPPPMHSWRRCSTTDARLTLAHRAPTRARCRTALTRLAHRVEQNWRRPPLDTSTKTRWHRSSRQRPMRWPPWSHSMYASSVAVTARNPGQDALVVAKVRVRGRVACEHEQRTLFAVSHRCLPGGWHPARRGVTSAARNR
jgi:hypothetical protein